MNNITTNKIKNESGIVLIAALVVMVLLTLLGTAGIMTSTTEVKIGKNYNTSVAAFYVSEGGRASGEDWINTNVGSGAPNANFSATYGTGYYDSQSSDLDLSTLTWNNGDSQLVGTDARYVVEYLGETLIQTTGTTGVSLGIGGGEETEEIRYIYRVSARGTSQKGTSTVQSTYAIR